MDTNKENDLMKKLEQSVPGGDTGYLPDGRPKRPGLPAQTVNRAAPTGGNGSSQTKNPALANDAAAAAYTGSAGDSESGNSALLGRIETFGAEAVYNAGDEDQGNR